MAYSMPIFQEATASVSESTKEASPGCAGGCGCLQCGQFNGSGGIGRSYNSASLFDQGTTCPDCKGGRTCADCLTCSGTGVVCKAYGSDLTRQAGDFTDHVSWDTCPDCGGHPKTVMECRTCNGSGVVGSTTDNGHTQDYALAGSYVLP
ncbi:unnamed protein product [Diplocarpon coronariae]|uniref:Uncharacterized protein n=1 Tax=Diplocarpon coronariae TaxID=2795749 RepID=A0A218Z7N0_9HELO|nr:hypothetical protein JHW43_006236 [Diplocarpon mali]OWP03620.1 hypothetical protein B2J93_3241 [Marssonina coronariae]